MARQYHIEVTLYFLNDMKEKNKMKRPKVVLAMALWLALSMATWSAVPHLINYQGLLKTTAGTPVPNASYSIAFTIYDGPTLGATNLWTETQTVTTASGLFAVQLGIGPIPLVDSIFNDTTRYLGIKVGADPEMTPRQRLSSVGYSYNSSEWTSAAENIFRLNGKVGIGTSFLLGNSKLNVYHSDSDPFSSIGITGEANNGSTGNAYGGYFIGNSSGGGNGYGVSATGGDFGLVGASTSGTGIGVYGTGELYGLYGSGSGYGVYAAGATGVFGQGSSYGVYAAGGNYGVYGSGSTYGVFGTGAGLGGDFVGTGGGSYGVHAAGVTRGVYATGGDYGGDFVGTGGGSYGVHAAGVTLGVHATGGDVGVFGGSTNGTGVYASSPLGPGVQSFGGTNGVEATGTSRGVYASGGTIGVLGVATSNVFPSYGIYGSNGGNFSTTYAGYFAGSVYISNDLEVEGIIWKYGGGFKIDHPTDPANKYLYHSFVESPDMKNIYDGVVTLDTKGEANVTLPDWLEVENKDFRYQLTAIGAPGPNLYIAEEISSNQFKIAGGVAGMKVSWQVTGIRQDAWANAHRFPVEEEKSASEKGKYKNPKEHGVSETLGIHYEERQKADAEQKKMEVAHKQQEEQQAKMQAERKLQEEQRAKMDAERKLQEAQRPQIAPKQ